MLDEYRMPFILLTETWLREHLDAELSIPNYTLYRSDRTRQKKTRGRNSGGAAIYLRSSLPADVLFKYSDGINEAICIRVNPLNLVLCSLYRQPDDPVGGNRSTSTEFKKVIDKLSNEVASLPSPTPNIIIGGDFNLPHATWPSGYPTQGSTPDERKMLEIIREFSTQHFLVQVSEEATHRAGNVLDLVLTNCADLFISSQSLPAAPISSHHLVKFTVILSATTDPSEVKTTNDDFDKVNVFSEDVNWQAIRLSLQNTHWGTMFSSCSVDDMMKQLIAKCRHLAVQYAPPKMKRKPKYMRIPRHRKILMRKRTRLRKNYSSHTNPATLARIKDQLTGIERKLQDSYRSQEKHDESVAVTNIKKNSKYFFSYARRKARLSIPVGPLEDPAGNLVTNPMDIAKILSTQYQSVFSTPSPIELDFSSTPERKIEDIQFTEQDIIDAIDEIPINSAPGPDRLPAFFLKQCKHELAKPLYILWRRSLDSGVVPEDAKTSNIVPIHKGGKRSIAKNYRPVALTSHLAKVFEKVVRARLISHIEQNNMMNPNQHGFRAGRSCLSQLVQHQDQITKLLEDGQNVDVIYLDFSKAFDKLDIKITLQKLYHLGIMGRLFDWIEGFLTDRKQCVIVDSVVSEKIEVISGVPQGSVLGPLLYLILLRDIDANVSSARVSSFADDTRVFAGINSVEASEQLQQDLNTIYDWAVHNNAEFNNEKFELLRYGNNKDLQEATSYKTSSNTFIEKSENVRDLGIMMTSDATFIQHIQDVTLSASLKCAWILRVFQTRERVPLLTLWKSLVAPVLEYCCQLWNPSTPGVIQSLEMVQHSYLSKISGFRSMDYWEQLSTLGMPSLQRRRERYMCIYIWKVLEGLVPNFGLQASHNPRRGRSCIVPEVSRVATHKIQTIRHNSLGVLGPRLFNHLPQSVRNVSGCSVDTFKRELGKHLDTVPDEPRIPKLVKYCSKSSNSLISY